MKMIEEYNQARESTKQILELQHMKEAEISPRPSNATDSKIDQFQVKNAQPILKTPASNNRFQTELSQTRSQDDFLISPQVKSPMS